MIVVTTGTGKGKRELEVRQEARCRRAVGKGNVDLRMGCERDAWNAWNGKVVARGGRVARGGHENDGGQKGRHEEGRRAPRTRREWKVSGNCGRQRWWRYERDAWNVWNGKAVARGGRENDA